MENGEIGGQANGGAWPRQGAKPKGRDIGGSAGCRADGSGSRRHAQEDDGTEPPDGRRGLWHRGAMIEIPGYTYLLGDPSSIHGT